jgi:hypothetical protein
LETLETLSDSCAIIVLEEGWSPFKLEHSHECPNTMCAMQNMGYDDKLVGIEKAVGALESR